MSQKKNLFMKTMSATTLGLGCGCDDKALSRVLNPKPKPKPRPRPRPTPSGRSFIASSASGTRRLPLCCSSPPDTNSVSFRLRIPYAKIDDSLAVEKSSDDPYQDFRHSMVQMILEKEIYAREDLQELLVCFLELNSTRHHHAIVRAFTEIWDELVVCSRDSYEP